MAEIVTVNTRGTLTLPKVLRERMRLRGGAQLIAEEMDGGVLLRPSVTFPVELYSPERLEEFRRNNEEALAGRLAQKKKR